MADLTRDQAIEWCVDHKADFVTPVFPPPDGWKLVPFDPTQEMQQAGDCAVQEENVWSETIWHAMLEAAPSHSQQSEQSTNVWESALLDAANAVVHANQNNTGYEPSRSLLACLIDELREILDDANIDFPGDTDRCPSHESQQSASTAPDSEGGA